MRPVLRNGARSPSSDLRAFYRISRLGALARRPEEIGRRALAYFCRAMGFSRGSIHLLAPERRRLHLFCALGDAAVTPSTSMALRDYPFAPLLARRGRGIDHSRQRRGRGRRSRWSRRNGAASDFAVPLRARGRMIGALAAGRDGQPLELSRPEVELGTALAALVADVIDGSLERQGRARRHHRMLLLNKASRAISAEENLSALLGRLARIIQIGTGCHGVIIRLHDERARGLRVVAAAGPGSRAFAGQICSTTRGRGSLSPGALSFLADRPVLQNRTAPLRPMECYWPGIHSALVIPIRVRARPIGVLRLEARQRFTFDEGDVRIFSILGEQIGYAVRRALMLHELRKKQSELRAVSQSLEASLEDDRRRIARELHDELAQAMTAAKYNLGLLHGALDGSGPEARRLIHETSGLLDHTIAETRRISMDLRPTMLDELGLMPALRWYAGVFSERTGIRTTLRARGAESRVRRELETLLYRFVQEGLTNVARHARARRVQIQVGRTGSRMQAVVGDDGIGMSPGQPSAHGLGLLGMRERIERAGGVLKIHSKPGQGTRLEADIPIGPRAVLRIEPLHAVREVVP